MGSLTRMSSYNLPSTVLSSRAVTLSIMWIRYCNGSLLLLSWKVLQWISISYLIYVLQISSKSPRNASFWRGPEEWQTMVSTFLPNFRLKGKTKELSMLVKGFNNVGLRVGYLIWHVKFSESKWAELNVFVSGTLLPDWCFDPILDPCVSKYFFYKEL